MKPKLWWLALFLTTGCASSALTVDGAKQYAGLDINQFLDERFSDRQSKRVEGGVRYKAYFTDVNYAQLKRPTTELMNFCKAQGGNPERTKAYAGNPFGRHYVAPLAAGLQADAGARERGFHSTVGQVAMQETIEAANKHNDMMDRRSAGYRASKDLYGDWSCQGVARPWTASVVPVEFIPSRPDASVVADAMMIEIRPR